MEEIPALVIGVSLKDVIRVAAIGGMVESIWVNVNGVTLVGSLVIMALSTTQKLIKN